MSDVLLVAGAALIIAAAYVGFGLAASLATGGVMLLLVSRAVERGAA